MLAGLRWLVVAACVACVLWRPGQMAAVALPQVSELLSVATKDESEGDTPQGGAAPKPAGASSSSSSS